MFQTLSNPRVRDTKDFDELININEIIAQVKGPVLASRKV